MPLSDKSVIKSGDSLKAVMEYAPKTFSGEMTEQAKDYLRRRKQRDFDFRLSDEVSTQTKIADAERAQLAEEVEQKALEKLQEVQEKAYAEAHSIGLEEGKAKAFTEYSEHILEHLFQLAEVVKSLKSLKSDLIKYNESHIMHTVLQLASRVAMREIEMDQTIIVDVLKKAIAQAQAEENVTVQVSHQDLKFLEFLREETDKDLEFLKGLDFEANDSVVSGGCIIETNYGVVDATVEERVDKLWSSLKGNIPKSKDRVE